MAPLAAHSKNASSRLLETFQAHRLTPTQRRVAHCLVEHAGEAAYASCGEIAGRAKVSQPSVTRFAVALLRASAPLAGYFGYFAATVHPDVRVLDTGGSQLVFDLHAGPMVLAMVLLQGMCGAAPAQAHARREQFERSAAERRVFVP